VSARVRRWAYPLLALLLGLAAAELLARAAEFVSGDTGGAARERAAVLRPADGRIVGARDPDADIELHPYLGFIPAGGTLRSTPAFAGPALVSAGGDATFNVVVTGGSVAANFLAEMAADLEVRLAERFRARLGHKHVRVYGLAAGGWHQPQQALALTWYRTLGAHIDLVINLDGFNEVVFPPAQVLRGYALELPRAWPKLTDGLLDASARDAVAQVAIADRARTDWARITQAPVLAWSSAVALLWKLVDRPLRSSLNDALTAAERSKNLAPFQRGFADASGLEPADRAVEIWASSSRTMDLLQRAAGGAYLHVLQPNQYVDGSKELSDAERRYAYQPDSYPSKLARSGYPKLQAAGARLAADGVAFVDATDVYAETKDTIYVDSCCHVNALGNRLLLDRIVGSLDESLVFDDR